MNRVRGYCVFIADMEDVDIKEIQAPQKNHSPENDGSSPLKFKQLTLEALPEIYPYLSGLTGLSCDYTAGGLFMWIDYFKYKYCIYDDTLFIKGVAEDNLRRKAFSMPIGRMPLVGAVTLLKNYCNEHGFALEFSAITDVWLDGFKELHPKEISELEQWRDYIYDIEALATLKGKKLSKKRNHCNRFAQDNPEAELQPILPHNTASVEECFKRVCIEGKQSPMAQYEREQVWKVLKHLDSYPFEVMCLKCNDEVVAFTIGEVLNNVLHIHIEKSLREVSGAAETINRAFAAHILDKYPHVKWINRQDDAGDEGLRQAKLSYCPAFLLRKYNVVF